MFYQGFTTFPAPQPGRAVAPTQKRKILDPLFWANASGDFLQAITFFGQILLAMAQEKFSQRNDVPSGLGHDPAHISFGSRRGPGHILRENSFLG